MSRTRSDLDRSLVHGIAWTSAVTWFSQLLSWGATFYVIHHLQKSDYGLVATALMFLGIVQMFSEFGVGSAVVRFQSLSRDHIAQFNGLSLLLGVSSAAFCAIFAWPVAWLFNDTVQLPALIRVMSLGFVITALRVVPASMMQRDLKFRKLAVMEGIMSISMAISNITMATLGFGKWTLALGPMIGSTIAMIMVVSQNPLPFRWPNLKDLGQSFEFSRQIIITRFAWWGYSNADFFIIRKTLGNMALGAYVIGWTVSGIAVEKVTALVGRVTPAFFSAVQDSMADVRRYLLLLTEVLSILTFPMCVGLALVANDVVTFVLGEEWRMAALPLRLLAILACVRSIDPLVQQSMVAIGEAKMNLNNTLITVCVLPIGFYAGRTLGLNWSGAPVDSEVALSWGINGVAIAWVILGPLLFSRLLFRALKRIELPVSGYFGALWPAVSSCLMMAAVVGLLNVTLPSASLASFSGKAITGAFTYGKSMWLSSIVFFVLKVVAGALTYTGTLWFMHRNRVLMARDIVKMVRSGPPVAATTQSDGAQLATDLGVGEPGVTAKS